MNEEPSGNTPPPEPIWIIWEWLILLSPALVMILEIQYKQERTPGEYSGLAGMFSVVITGPIAVVMCLLITVLFGWIGCVGAFGIVFRNSDGSGSRFAGLVAFFFGLVAANLAIAFAGCAMIVK